MNRLSYRFLLWLLAASFREATELHGTRVEHRHVDPLHDGSGAPALHFVMSKSRFRR